MRGSTSRVLAPCHGHVRNGPFPFGSIDHRQSDCLRETPVMMMFEGAYRAESLPYAAHADAFMQPFDPGFDPLFLGVVEVQHDVLHLG